MGNEKEPKQAAFNPAADLAAGRLVQPYDFSGVVTKTENMNDPELVILWSSRFTAVANSLGSQLIMKAARDGALGNPKPDYLALSRLTDDETSVAATPALEESASTVPIRWIEEGTRAIVSLGKLFTVRRFPIPRHTTVHIPISEETIDRIGPSLILHLSKATYAPIDSRERERAVAPTQPTAPRDPSQGTD